MNTLKQQRQQSSCDSDGPDAAHHSGTNNVVNLDPRISRRSAILAGVASGIAMPGILHAAQEAPPIEPRDDSHDGSETVIEPEAESETETESEEELEPTESSSSDEPDTIVSEAETEGNRYFAQTGHNLSEPFLQTWAAMGGEEGAGLPISEARFIEGEGTIRQDFEAMALLYDPDPEADSAVRGAPLPPAEADRIAPPAAREPVQDCTLFDQRCQFFPESGQKVAGEMARVWNTFGGARILGIPVSRQFERGRTTTQVFANAVVELKTDGTASLRKINTDIAASAFPGDAAFAPAPPTLGETTLVTASEGLRLRSGPDANSDVIVLLPENAEFIAVAGETGDWVPGYADGYSGWVSSEYLTRPEALPEIAVEDWRLDVWQGAALGETNVRREPRTSGTSVRTVAAGAAVTVVDWVEGEEVIEGDNIWAKLDDGSFVYVRNIGRSAPVQPPPLPDDAPSDGKWIDIHLTQQLMVAYEGRDPVRTVVMTSGKPGWETPAGYFSINTRVANETMESGSIGADRFYVLEDVLFTQYFTNVGHALHFAWWKTPETIGRPGSHGCINLLLDDARFFWDWAEIGTPVYCRAAPGTA
jgi:hypothetical protein